MCLGKPSDPRSLEQWQMHEAGRSSAGATQGQELLRDRDGRGAHQTQNILNQKTRMRTAGTLVTRPGPTMPHPTRLR